MIGPHAKNDLVDRADRAQAYFKSKWPKRSQEESEDFRSYCLEQWLSGRHPATELRFLVVDFFRESGDKRQRPNTPVDGPRFLRQKVVALTTELRTLKDKHDYVGRYIQSTGIRNIKDTVLMRAVLILFFEWGLAKTEIADVFGVHPTRINQIMSDALVLQKKRL